MKLSRSTSILLGVLGLVTLIGGYIMYTALKPEDYGDGTVTEEEAQASQAEVLFINLASQIDNIQFDESLFTDPRFAALVDMRVGIIEEESGREDPFANIVGLPKAPR